VKFNQILRRSTMKNKSEKAYMNGRMLKGYTIIAAVLFIFYVLEGVKGSRTIGYLTMFTIFLGVPYLLCILAYKKNTESDAIKYIASVGYTVFYGFVLMTSTSVLNFSYIFPVLVLLSLYGDLKVTYISGSLAVCANVIFVIYKVAIGETEASQVVGYEISIASMVLTVLLNIISSRALQEVNANRANTISQEKEKIASVLELIKKATEKLFGNVSNIGERSDEMSKHNADSQSAIADIVTGTNDLAHTVENQLKMTENIDELIASTGTLTSNIKSKCENADSVSNDGFKKVTKLTEVTEASKAVSGEVKNTLSELVEQTKEAEKMLNLISNIMSR
jgi:methyl-accepting chemotaxis protein